MLSILVSSHAPLYLILMLIKHSFFIPRPKPTSQTLMSSAACGCFCTMTKQSEAEYVTAALREDLFLHILARMTKNELDSVKS